MPDPNVAMRSMVTVEPEMQLVNAVAAGCVNVMLADTSFAVQPRSAPNRVPGQD